MKKRTLALNLGRERGEEFLIPLNVNGLRPADLSWMVSDLAYVPFHMSWAQRLAQLLKKLQSVDTPRPVADGWRVVVDWFAARDSVNNAPERLWMNLMEITELPSMLLKPRLGTYDGWETPVPMRIDVQHGEVDLEQVASDILGLTKLNYNACKLGEGEPVTIGLSDAVGEILVSNPTVSERSPKFKFYI